MRLDEPALWHGTVRNAGGPGVDCYGRVRETEDGIIVEVVRGVGDGRLEWVREPDGSKLMVPILVMAFLEMRHRARADLDAALDEPQEPASAPISAPDPR